MKLKEYLHKNTLINTDNLITINGNTYIEFTYNSEFIRKHKQAILNCDEFKSKKQIIVLDEPYIGDNKVKDVNLEQMRICLVNDLTYLYLHKIVCRRKTYDSGNDAMKRSKLGIPALSNIVYDEKTLMPERKLVLTIPTDPFSNVRDDLFRQVQEVMCNMDKYIIKHNDEIILTGLGI